MGYSPDKILNKDLKQLILDAIKDRLDQHPDIGQNDSLAYFGVHVEFNIGLTLLSRSEVETSVSGKKLIGDPNAISQVSNETGLKLDSSKVRGEVHKGKAKRATNEASV